jgi:hypothetical protein
MDVVSGTYRVAIIAIRVDRARRAASTDRPSIVRFPWMDSWAKVPPMAERGPSSFARGTGRRRRKLADPCRKVHGWASDNRRRRTQIYVIRRRSDIVVRPG